jgi:hypothetical protein
MWRRFLPNPVLLCGWVVMLAGTKIVKVAIWLVAEAEEFEATTE